MLSHQVDQFAAGLLALNLSRGDRIGIWGPNSYEWVLVQWAAARAGLILVKKIKSIEVREDKSWQHIVFHLQVNINPAYKSDELCYALNLVGVKALVMAPKFRNFDLLTILKDAAPELTSASGTAVSGASVPSLKHVILLSSNTEDKALLCWQDVMSSSTAKLIEQVHNIQRRIQFDEPTNIQFTSVSDAENLYQNQIVI